MLFWVLARSASATLVFFAKVGCMHHRLNSPLLSGVRDVIGTNAKSKHERARTVVAVFFGEIVYRAHYPRSDIHKIR